MNILILNGSPRKQGNTQHALSTIAQGITENTSNTIEIVDVTRLNIAGCSACDACRNNGGNCVHPDDSKAIIDKVSAADMLIFGSPVYWWGVSAQLKAVMDKFYSKAEEFMTRKKKFAVVAVGQESVPAKQYTLIHDQFDCIGNFLKWEKVFELSFSAHKVGDLQKSKEANAELAEIWKKC